VARIALPHRRNDALRDDLISAWIDPHTIAAKPRQRGHGQIQLAATVNEQGIDRRGRRLADRHEIHASYSNISIDSHVCSLTVCLGQAQVAADECHDADRAE
jgi:hypothetical protein